MADLLDRLTTALGDRYHIERELGHGGMATVYLARDLKHDRPVALKVLRPQLAKALGPDRFLREIHLSARLAHPHIVPLLDSGDADGVLYYVMPFLEGESLSDRLKREAQLPVADAVEITLQVASALDHAHKAGVLHRDIKPENIMFEAGHAVVTDFGIARAIDQAGGEGLTTAGVVVGTPTYMSPEQAAGNQDLDGRSDLYSLAAVLFEMLAGAPPHSGVTAQVLLARRIAESAPSIRTARPAVSDALDAVMIRALQRAPADRYKTVGEFAVALAQAAGDGGRPGGAPREKSRRVNTRRRVAIAGLAVLVILGLLAVVLLLARSHRHEAVGLTDPGLDPAVAVMPFRAVGGDLARLELKPVMDVRSALARPSHES